jgi:hypothetical protein
VLKAKFVLVSFLGLGWAVEELGVGKVGWEVGGVLLPTSVLEQSENDERGKKLAGYW